MAETTNRIILKIDFDGNNAVQQTVSLRKAFEELQGERQKLLQKVQEGNALTEKERVQLELLNAKIKENQRETRAVTKFIDDSLKVRKAETGSIEANRAKLAQLTAEYIKTAKPTKEQTANIKALSDTLKAQEKAIGDNRRNVGNYAESLSGLGGPIGGAVQGVKGFNTALSASPLTAVITLVVSLGNQLLKLKPVADFLEAAFAGINAAFSSFVGAAGKFLSGDFSGAFADFGKNVSEAFTQTKNLTTATQKLEDAERAVQTTISANQTKIDQLLLQSKNRSLSEQERVALIEQASKIEEENLNLQLKNAKEAKRIIDEKNALAAKNGELLDEQEQQAVDAQLKIDELNRNSIILQEKIQNRKDALLDAAAAKEQQRLEDSKKRAEEAQKILREQADFIRNLQFEIDQEFEKREEEKKEKKKKADEEELKRIIENVEKEDAELNKKREQRLRAEEEYAKASIELEQAKFDAVQGLIQLASLAAGENAKVQAALFAFSKAVAIGEIIIDLQTQIAKTAAVNAALGPAGVPLTAAQNTAAAIRAATSIALITAQAITQFKKGFYDGGYTGDGDPHEQSTNLGVKPYTYHKGEYVVPNKVLKTPQGAQYVGALEAMRRSTPGSLAYLGGYADGGFTTRALAERVNQQIQSSDIIRAFQSMPTPIVRVSEIKRVSGNLERAINVSDL